MLFHFVFNFSNKFGSCLILFTISVKSLLIFSLSSHPDLVLQLNLLDSSLILFLSASSFLFFCKIFVKLSISWHHQHTDSLYHHRHHLNYRQSFQMDYLTLVFYFSSFRQRWPWKIFDLTFLFLLFFVLSAALSLSLFRSNSDVNNFSKLTFSLSLLKRLFSLALVLEEHPSLHNLFEVLPDI